MKKIKLLLLLPLMLLTGCQKTDEEGHRMLVAPNFVEICRHNNLSYIKDRDTNIMYLYYSASYHTGLSPYYNEQGEPMTYEEFQVVHTVKYH